MVVYSEQREKTLHVSLGSQCNNNCIFCMEPRFIEDSHNRKIEEHKEFISNSFLDGFSRIVFTRKEPTLAFSKLIPLIKHAKYIGYEDIMLITNGRLLSYRPFVLKLLKAGLNHVEISLHGSNKEMHESLTRTPGSYEQVKKCLQNIYALSRKYPIFYSINFTITKLNYKNIPDFYSLASSFSPNSIVFNFYCTKSEGKKRSDLLMPNYSEVIGELRKVRSGNFSLIDFPFCVIPRELSNKVGHIEDFHLLKKLGNGKYRRNDWQSTKRKLEKCGVCKFLGFCPNPSMEYVQKYGHIEFKPIR